MKTFSIESIPGGNLTQSLISNLEEDLMYRTTFRRDSQKGQDVRECLKLLQQIKDLVDRNNGFRVFGEE